MHPTMEPLYPDSARTRTWSSLVALLGTFGLLGLVLVSFIVGGAFAMGSDNCFPEMGDDALIWPCRSFQPGINGSAGQLVVGTSGPAILRDRL
ncbi:hypothetical protein [Micromonospora sp. NPDC005087]|uniref:hypothetical protein n=1 Tax=Micromonospora sp. NPDC005087 TaxID=3364225 RepID=UPI0036BDD0CB